MRRGDLPLAFAADVRRQIPRVDRKPRRGARCTGAATPGATQTVYRPDAVFLAYVGIPFTVLILPDVTQNLDDPYAWCPIHDAVTRWGREL
jgi:hypothetical protein